MFRPIFCSRCGRFSDYTCSLHRKYTRITIFIKQRAWQHTRFFVHDFIENTQSSLCKILSLFCRLPEFAFPDSFLSNGALLKHAQCRCDVGAEEIVVLGVLTLLFFAVVGEVVRGHGDEFLHGDGCSGEGETELDVLGGAEIVANHLDFGHVEVDVEIVVRIDLMLDTVGQCHAEYLDETRAHAMAVCFRHLLAHDDDDDGSFHALRFHGSLRGCGQN